LLFIFFSSYLKLLLFLATAVLARIGRWMPLDGAEVTADPRLLRGDF